MFLVGQKVITPDGVQGYVDEVTQFDEVVVVIPIEKVDAHTLPYNKTVRETYDNDGESLKRCAIQHPLLNDFTRFGVIRKLESITGGIVLCGFNECSDGALWLSKKRVQQSNGAFPFEDNFWVHGKHTDDVLDHFDLEYLDTIIVQKGLVHADIANCCIVQVILPNGNLAEYSAEVNDCGDIESIEIEVENGIRQLSTITELKELGVTRAQLVSTYSIQGFDDIG